MKVLYTGEPRTVISVIGERLAEVRKDHGDTQQTLADKLNVTKFTVSNWEQEKSEPYHAVLVRICRLYGVSADYLLGLSDVDPAYQRRKMDTLNEADRMLLKEMEEFLRWRNQRMKKQAPVNCDSET